MLQFIESTSLSGPGLQALRSMVGVFKGSFWLSIGLAALLAGCSAASVIDRLPSDMAVPAAAPARPVTPYEYPAVHDMPPDRASVPMTEDEQVKVEKELATARDRQEGRPGTDKKPLVRDKKAPKDAENGQTAGAKANP